MPVGRVSGYPDYSNSGTRNIPLIFAAETLVKFYASTVFGEIANTDYEGEIKNQGDEVIIRTVPDVTIKDYVKGQKLDLERPESNSVSLLIDKAKYFNCALDDIDRVQMDLNMIDKWAQDAAEQMKIVIDAEILAYLNGTQDSYNGGATAGKISQNINLGTSGSPLTLSSTNILDTITKMGQVLDEQNIPETDRWIVMPAWMAQLLKMSDIKDVSLTGDRVTPLRNGKIGMIDRFTVYMSNQIDKSSSTYFIPFGHKSALTFALQLSKTEVYRPQDTFSDAIKGLMVYGYKTIKKESLGMLVATK